MHYLVIDFASGFSPGVSVSESFSFNRAASYVLPRSSAGVCIYGRRGGIRLGYATQPGSRATEQLREMGINRDGQYMQREDWVRKRRRG